MQISAQYGEGVDLANLLTRFIVEAARVYIEEKRAQPFLDPQFVNFLIKTPEKLVLMKLKKDKGDGFYKVIVGYHVHGRCPLFKIDLYSGDGKNIVSDIRPYTGSASPELQRRLISQN